jgi:hypothetical protein
MSPDSTQLLRYIGDMARQMAIMADDPSLNVIRYLLHLVVEEADILKNLETANEQKAGFDKLHFVDPNPIHASHAKLQIAAMPVSRRADLRGRFSGPTLERMVEGAGFLIAE